MHAAAVQAMSDPCKQGWARLPGAQQSIRSVQAGLDRAAGCTTESCTGALPPAATSCVELTPSKLALARSSANFYIILYQLLGAVSEMHLLVDRLAVMFKQARRGPPSGLPGTTAHQVLSPQRRPWAFPCIPH